MKDFWLIVPLSLSCPCREWSNLGSIWLSLLSSFCSSQTTCAMVLRWHQLPVGHSCPSIQVDGWLWLVKSVALSPGLWRVAVIGLAVGESILHMRSASIDLKRTEITIMLMYWSVHHQKADWQEVSSRQSQTTDIRLSSLLMLLML